MASAIQKNDVTYESLRLFCSIIQDLEKFQTDSYEALKSLDEYDLYDFIFGRMDYSKKLFKDDNTYLVTGHTPTAFIDPAYKGRIFRKNNLCRDPEARRHLVSSVKGKASVVLKAFIYLTRFC